MEPLPASFYGAINDKNPVIVTFENEIKLLLANIKTVSKLAPGDRYQESRRQGASTLFNLWTKFEPRLPAEFYHEKLLKVGDLLTQLKEYKLALLQCYERYLLQFKLVNADQITDVNEFKSTFFPNGIEDEKAGLTFHALQGRCICIYQTVKINDTHLQNEDSMKRCLSILSLLRLNMQVVLPLEHLCWLIYNGTIHIYTICRHLMSLGHSAKALEYLLWASICMESSAPLLSVHYLTWRVTLYTAVCQCYYDCHAGVHGEVFARRGLSKIVELHQLELTNKSKYSEASKAFTEATTKMALMIFKRVVFESRRKPKGILRQKPKPSLKDVEKMSWPRNQTERLLSEMFDGRALHFFAIIEALSDSNRRVFKNDTVLPDEPEIQEVVTELFFAGKDIILDQGIKRPSPSSMIKVSSTLLQLMAEETEGISVDAAMKFLKLAFSYEQWDIFDNIVPNVFNFIQREDNSTCKKQAMEIKLLIAMEPLISGKQPLHGLSAQDFNARNEDFFVNIGGRTVTFKGESVKSGDTSDDLFILAETLYLCVCNNPQAVQPDKEMVVDALMFLWEKCKSGFLQIQTGSTDCSRFNQKFEASSKVVYFLWLINEVIQSCDIVEIHPVLLAEVALRLAVAFENMPDSRKKKSVKLRENINMDSPEGSPKSISPVFMKKTPTEQLLFAYDILENAINEMAKGRAVTKLSNETSITDNYPIQVDSKGVNQTTNISESETSSKSTRMSNYVMDLHLELILAQHRVSVKILNLLQDEGKSVKSKKPFYSEFVKSISFLTEPELMDKINKNELSRAIFLLQKAALIFNRNMIKPSPHQLLTEAFLLIQKAEAEETTISVKRIESTSKRKSSVPPPPILISRTHSSMTFKPAPFVSDVKVCWYCLLGRKASGSSTTIRINDYHIPGSGEMIPAVGNNFLEVNGLEANEKYTFAIAAYSANGKLIGDTVGASTKPILAYPSLPVLVTWAYMMQVAYQVKNYTLAKKAFSVLWEYFVSASPSPSFDVSVISASNTMTVSQKSLRVEAVSQASPILLELFLVCIFSASDISVQEGALFCDSVSANGTPYKWQLRRITECERMLVALELSNYLDDTNYALQAVVQCYGLLAPIIYHKIPSVPVVQILMKCLAVLQEIPSSAWQKKPSGCTESVMHMIACTICFLAKVLRSWREYDLAVLVIDIGKRLLLTERSSIINLKRSRSFSSEDSQETDDGKVVSVKKILKKKVTISVLEKMTEQLAALEANLLRLTTPFPGRELTGQENPVLLLPIVTCWPVHLALKEVMKFKGKVRFLEFFVKVLQRTVHEEKFEEALEWTGNMQDYLKKRNDIMLGKKGGRDLANITVTGEAYRRYTAALVEYQQSREKGTKSDKQTEKPSKMKDKKKQDKKKQDKKQPESFKSSQSDPERKAFGTLVVLLTPHAAKYVRRKTFCRAFTDEMPWRSQMNVLLAITYFNFFKQQLAQQFEESSEKMRRFGVLDPEVFSLYHSGTVIMEKVAKTEEEKDVWLNNVEPPLKKDPKTKRKQTADSETISERSRRKSSSDSPRTQRTNETEYTRSPSIKEETPNLSLKYLLDDFSRTFLHLRRAVVLAHRGCHWTLLQNVCRELWNITLEAQLISKHRDFPITLYLINRTICLPFYLASDMIMDMIITLQNNSSIQIIDSTEDFSIPSCTGGIANDEGGSNLTFDYPMDDVNVVDLRWICDLILKTIEILYLLRKWEAMVHIAIQFNIITHERYTEQVTPLLVHAQRQLIDQISLFDGPENPQPHFKYKFSNKVEVNCRNIIGKQLHVATVYEKLIGTDGKHSIYSDIMRAKALVSVPLDVMETLKYFRESLEKSKYHSRALRHSRKLYSLFLAHTQGLDASDRKSTSGKVEFRTDISQAQVPVPPDLLKEKYTSLSMIQSSTMSPSQLSVVISSYDKTIEVLHTNKMQGLKAQALHELGNLHLYARHKRAAFKCWCQALDETFNMTDVLNTWQERTSFSVYSNLKSSDYSEQFLNQSGIWGCLQAAMITSKIAQYILTSNVKLRKDCCILSSLLFKALLRASLSHPKNDCDYALYEIDEEYEGREVIPGIDLFSDRYRADISTVVACLSFIIMELYSAGANLLILPLFTLYQYFVCIVCHEPIKSVEVRILKVKVLTNLGYFSEACYELFQIYKGRRIPKRLGEGFRYVANDLLIQDLLNEKPSPEFMSLCEHQIMNKLILAKMHFIVSLCTTMSIIPEALEKSSYTVTQEIMPKTTKGKVESRAQAQKQQPLEVTITIQLVAKEDLSKAKLKGILLTEADIVVTTLLEDLEKSSNSMIFQWPAIELELAIEGKLLLLTVAQQRYQTALSVAMAISIIHLLQDADIFKTKQQSQGQVAPSAWSPSRKTREHSSAYGTVTDNLQLPHNREVRDRLNIHLWFRCRLALIASLVKKVHGIGLIKEWNILDCSSLITEAIVEADAFGGIETQAKLMLEAVLLDLQEGRPKKGIKRFLREIIFLLEGKLFVSPEASLTLVQALMLLADIFATDHKHSEMNHLNVLIQANNMINKQLLIFGQAIEQHLEDPVHTGPLLPLRNIYLPHISLLTKVKLRLGNAVAQEASRTFKTQDSSHWLPALRLFISALELCRRSSMHELDLEAEILFQKGKVERQIMIADHLETLQAVESFLDAINTSQKHDQNFRLIRKAYLELALSYFHLACSGTNKKAEVAQPKPDIIDKKKMTNTINENETTLRQSEIYKLQAWIAIRAATQVNEAMTEYYQIIGEESVTLNLLPRDSQQQLPGFASMDLLANYKDFLSDDYQLIYKDALLQEQSVEEEEKPTEEIETVSRDDDESQKILWFHLISYHNQLMKLAAMTCMTVSSHSMNEVNWRGDTLYTSVVHMGNIQRLAEMHLFLKKNLSIYSVCCIDELPEELYPYDENSFIGETKPSKLNLESNEPEGTMSKENETRSAKDNMATNSPAKELCIQLYLPSLERPPREELMIMLLYAYNMNRVQVKNLKTCNKTDVFCGYVWMPLAGVVSLREKIIALKHQIEHSSQLLESLQLLESPEVSRIIKKKRSVIEKSKSETLQSGLKVEETFIQCCSEAKDLLSTSSYPKPLTEAPFECSMQSLTTLEKIFDPSGGCVIKDRSIFAWITSLLP
uniref:Cilia- and flagella-associated protein 54 isoform X2 n=1 Tax=Geotrypetes seraphini TaxID=260995 RepID=A0A6P8RP48_GEOSA|nr:cilia- and flagella-associated protein 54 isoform X2 [Geotrypetes seraphini]